VARATNLDEVLRNIRNPRRWADPETLYKVLEEVPSLRGIVYGNVAEVHFSRWLEEKGIPLESQTRDDDHLKTGSDRTIQLKGRQYTVQVKSMQTNSIAEIEPGVFQANIQVDASDRRTVTLPNGHTVSTTCYVAGEFDILAVPLHPIAGEWDFAFMLNSDLPRTRHSRYSPDDQQYLLKTLVKIRLPLDDQSGWTHDLFGLIAGAPDLGEVVDEREDVIVVRPPGEEEVAIIEETEGADDQSLF
jgi:hypothetical protein